MSFWLGSSAPSSNPSLAWSMGNGGKGRMLIKFPLPLDNGWYKEQPCTAFRCFQHRKELGGFTHEFIVLELLDGSICRIERMGDPDARFDALSPRGSVAHDMAQCFRPDELDQACLDSSKIIAKVELPCDYDLIDVLKICRAIHEGEKTRNYTLQVFNCYFFSLAIQVCLTRQVAQWEEHESCERWIFQIGQAFTAVPDTVSNYPLRGRSMIFRAYCALSPDNCSPNSENQLLEEIKQRLRSWISGISWDIEQDVAHSINNLLWHSTIDSGLNQLVEDKIKEIVLGIFTNRGPFNPNGGLDETVLPAIMTMDDLKWVLLLDLTMLLDTVYLPRDNTLKPEYRPLQSKKIKGTNTCHRALSELSFNASQAIRNSQDFLIDWQWIVYLLGSWLLKIAVIMCGLNLFAPRKDSFVCAMIDEQLEPILKELEDSNMVEHLKLERFSKQLNALSENKAAIWSRNPWTDIYHCVAQHLSIGPWAAAWKKNETDEPGLNISFCPKGQPESMVLQSVASYQNHILDRILIQAREVEGVWLGSAETIRVELIETLSLVWQLIREDNSSDTPVNAIGPGSSGQFFFTDEAGEVTLIIPEHLESQNEIKTFVFNALSSGEIDKSVRSVKCSRCKDNASPKLWVIKPSSLEQHIRHHFNIKSYRCLAPDCGAKFTTRDQQALHMLRRHSEIGEPPV